MLRDKNLIPLSHQHQHALALCVRIDRGLAAGAGSLLSWQAEAQQLFDQEIRRHFEAEENVLFPAAHGFSELRPLVIELVEEHRLLRSYFAQARGNEMDAAGLHAFARDLCQHIRKEEGQLFETMQRLMSPEALLTLGVRLEREIIGPLGSPSCPIKKRPSNL